MSFVFFSRDFTVEEKVMAIITQEEEEEEEGEDEEGEGER